MGQSNQQETRLTFDSLSRQQLLIYAREYGVGFTARIPVTDEYCMEAPPK